MKRLIVTVGQAANLKFIDPQTKKQESYSCDLFSGERILFFKDILYASEKKVYFVCLDGEIAFLPLEVISGIVVN
jgi:hypothetical protein